MTQPMKLLSKSLLAFVLITAVAVVGCDGCDEDGDGEPTDTGMDVADTEDVTEDTVDDADDAADDADDADDADEDADAGQATALNVEVYHATTGAPVEGATLTVEGESEQTDATGLAVFDMLDPGRTVIEVEASGWASTSEIVDLPAQVTTKRTIHLLPTSDSQTFDPTVDNDLFVDRVRVNIPADSLEDESGNPPSGDVEAIITPLNPSTEERAAFPGDFEGVLEGDDEPTPMESVLAADFRFLDGDGNELDLSAGSQATLEFVLPDDLQDEYSAGDQIEAFFYDESAGRWLQEGSGQVIDSTYAAGKLAWEVQVSHFSWWNCDAPLSDTNCVNVEVQSPGGLVGIDGAEVVLDGVSYNGTSRATTSSGGNACLDFKLGSTALLKVSGPVGQTPTGGSSQITGTNTPANCAGQGAGSCQTIQVQLAPVACLSGTVVDGSGNPVEGAEVSATYQGINGLQSVTGTTGTGGVYCLGLPQGKVVEVVASYVSGGTFRSDRTTLTSASTGQVCGNCTSVPDLTPQAQPTGCASGEVEVETATGVRGAAAGTNVYLFAEGGTTGDQVNVDCSQSPSDWGTLLSQTTTNASGEFCLSGPVTSDERTIVAGKCGTQGTTCLSARGTATLNQAGTCGGSSCTQVTPAIFLGNQCGEGP